MDSLNKLTTLLKFLGPELRNEYTGLIRDLREQAKKEKMIKDAMSEKLTH